jgi:hypothetical protein
MRVALRPLYSGAAYQTNNGLKNKGGILMIKYFIAWLLGVPAFLLIIIYFFMH